MEITLKRNHGFELIIQADNVLINEDIEERIYDIKTEDGRTDFTRVKRDIKTSVINQFVTLLDDMFYYRIAEYDSSDLIKNLFAKLPQDVCDELLDKLNYQYRNDIKE